MSHIPLTERVLAAIRPIEGLLCHVLQDAVTTADAAATGRLELPRTPPYQPVRVHMARARARKSLEDEVIPGWFVNDMERQNTALHMFTDGMAMRFLHTPTGVTPAPGPNRARRAWYTAALDGLGDDILDEEIKLIALWSADFRAGLVDVRVVRPVRTWSYGGKEKVDISIPLDASATFTSQGYDPRDEEEELPFPSREQAAEEEDGDSSAAR